MSQTATTSPAASRITAIASQLASPTASPPTTTSTAPKDTMAAAPKRPPITCHILDTTTGTPAPNVSCTLTLIRVPTPGPGQALSSSVLSQIDDNGLSFHALTNDDGRVTAWSPAGEGSQGAAQDLEAVLDKTHEMHWRVTFEIGVYYKEKGVTPFFNKVDIHFVTGGKGQEGREHYHVPLLVGPFNYTTYRGS